MALFTQENLIIPLTDYDGVDTASNVEMRSFSMKKYGHATIVMIFDTTMTGDNTLELECGATGSADTSDATFHYRLASATTTTGTACDVLAADATSSSLTLTAATYQDKMLIIELDRDELPTSGETVYDWVTPNFSGATAGNVTGIAILSKPRYAEAILDTAVT